MMNRKVKFFLVFGAALFLSACAEPEYSTSEPNEPAAEEGVFDPMVSTIDRAGQAEVDAAQRTDRIDAAIEQSE